MGPAVYSGRAFNSEQGTIPPLRLSFMVAARPPWGGRKDKHMQINLIAFQPLSQEHGGVGGFDWQPASLPAEFVRLVGAQILDPVESDYEFFVFRNLTVPDEAWQWDGDEITDWLDGWVWYHTDEGQRIVVYAKGGPE